jgi:hypothetical protein
VSSDGSSDDFGPAHPGGADRYADVEWTHPLREPAGAGAEILGKTAAPLDLDSLSQFTPEESGAPRDTGRSDLRPIDEPRFTRFASYPEPGVDEWADWMIDDGTAPIMRSSDAAPRVDLDLFKENELDRQFHAVEQARAEITRATAVLSGLEARVASLTAPGRALDSAADTIAHLERRANEASAQLERTERAKDALEREVVTLQRQLQALTSTTGSGEPAALSQSSPAAERAPASRPPHPPPSVPTRRLQTRRPLTSGRGRRVAVALGAFALVIIVGLLAIRSRAEPSRLLVSGATRDADESSVAALNGALSSRVLRFTNVAMPAGGSGTIVSAAPESANQAAVSSGGEADVPAPGRAIRVPASVTAPARMPTPTAASIEKPETFIGKLDVKSVPSGAVVFVNQKRVGETPLELDGLRAGSHVIWIERDGYERWSTSVLVSTAAEAHVTARLQPAQAR